MLRKVRNAEDLVFALLRKHLARPPFLWEKAKMDVKESEKLLNSHLFSPSVQEMSLGTVEILGGRHA